MFVYLLASLLTLIPAHLFEFRYFVPGLVIIILNAPIGFRQYTHMKRPRHAYFGLIATVITCYVINVLLVWVFVKKPFIWGDGSLARFML
jgi:hypothetical protein